MDFYEAKTMVANELYEDALKFLKTSFEVGDRISSIHMFVKFNCGDFASRMLLEMLAEDGYVTKFDWDTFKPRRVIELPE